METTFMTIHNLTPEANILFASESIYDILEYQPYEVIGKSCFEYFHGDDLPLARYGHARSLRLDKASVLYYARIITKNREWVTCECVFTVAYDVLVACTSIYRGDLKSHQRNLEAKQMRRLFSNPPRDPRYHMLEHLTPKFTAPIEPAVREPRSVLVLNRFSRDVPIMYASCSISTILGITDGEIRGKSFYECIQENCLDAAIACLESAKGNDSIAYLRFYYRDPRTIEDHEHMEGENSHSSDSEDGGVQLDNHSSTDGDMSMEGVEQNGSGSDHSNRPSWEAHSGSRTNSRGSSDIEHESANEMFDRQPQHHSLSSTSSSPPSSGGRERNIERGSLPSYSPPVDPIELEAVVSCSSDGLVVVLRKAPLALDQIAPEYTNGLFAAPWAANPVMPENHRLPISSTSGPPLDDFMNSIRDVAVFAWALTGINGSIADYSHGTPREQAVPPGGVPLWDPKAKDTDGYLGPENNVAQRRYERERMRGMASGSQHPYSRPRPGNSSGSHRASRLSSRRNGASQAYGNIKNGMLYGAEQGPSPRKTAAPQNCDELQSDTQYQALSGMRNELQNGHTAKSPLVRNQPQGGFVGVPLLAESHQTPPETSDSTGQGQESSEGLNPAGHMRS